MDRLAALWNVPPATPAPPLPDVSEVIAFARRMVRDLRNGFLMARRWLQHLGYCVALQAAILARA